MKVHGKVKRKGGAKAFQKAIKALDKSGLFVKVGLLGSKKAKRPGEALTNPEIGAVHEYGTSRLPARPWLGPAVRLHGAEYTEALAAVARKALKGEMSYRDGLKMIGQKAAADVKNFVTQGPEIPPPNAPATRERKEALTRRGGSPYGIRTLVDTGRMIDAVTYAIESGGKTK